MSIVTYPLPRPIELYYFHANLISQNSTCKSHVSIYIFITVDNLCKSVYTVPYKFAALAYQQTLSV